MDRLTAAEVFVRIAERGSMTAAAESLDMSRAMVTRYLAQMETWAGARLLHRTTRRLGLTAAGEQALARCRRMLELAAEMAAPVGEGAEVPRGLLRMASSQSLAQEVLSPAVAEFLRRHPLVAIDLHIDSRPVNLVQERIDLAVRISNDLDPNLIARTLGECASVVCAAPAYLAAHGTPRRAQDLATHDCLTYSYFGRSLWEFTHRGERIAVPVGGSLSANESQVLLAAALHGAGVTLQPVYAAAPLIAQGRLVALLPGHVPRTLGVHGVYASRRQVPPALRALLDFLVERFADPTHWQAGPSAPAAKAAARAKKNR